MKRISVFLLIAFVIFSAKLFAQQGIHGPKVVSAANTVVNEYTAITAFTPAGSTTIPVTASTLNANGRFTGNLAPGDLIMIYQAVGAIINSPASPDTSWGRVDPGNYFACGNYEFHQVVSVPNSTSIVIDCGTTFDYIPNAGTARKPEVIRVPRYTTLTINSGGVLTSDDWNGTIGGILAVEVQGNTVINAGGSIDLTAKGFRGGSLVGDNVTTFGVNTNASTNNALGAEKGEGISGYQSEYDVFGGRYCLAPGANGGGGGDGHNAGGGGGSNAPNSTSTTAYWSGLGIPDQSGPSWTSAWNIEPPVNTMSLRTSANSAGGGRGGYSFSANNGNAITQPPGNNAAWGGDSRNYQACGLGGRPLDYTTGRLFMGGGGGAGDQNNLGGGNGGDGGGLAYLMVFGNISGSGSVISNGQNGFNAVGGTGVITGIDGAGGGGGGGTIVLNAVGGVANTITISTNGGNGGNQVVNFPLSSNEGEGPGGGGGGGYIAVSSGTPTRNSNGGVNGTTNAGGLTEFIPNGATKGCPGTNNASITNFTISTSNITICSGSSTTLTAVLAGTVPGGTVVDWYANSVGGVPIATGTTYTTPSLVSTTTYWVGTCPGWWRVPVTVTVGPAPVVTSSATSTTICSGNSTTLTAAGATTYNWMPGNINGNPIVVSPAATTTYTVTGSTGPGCSATSTITITVNPTPTVTATALPTTVCAGNPTSLTGSGATTYVWNPGNISGSPISVSPVATTTYTVTGTSTGCSSTAQVTVTVNPTPTVTAVASSPTICSGVSTNLTGGGASTYNWNPGNINGSPISVTPASTTTYTVTGTGANGCTSTAQVTVTVNPTPTVTATALPTSICNGGSSTLTGGGATTYNWNPGNINGSPISVSPVATTTYTVTGTSSGCSSTSQVTVTVNALPVVTASASQSSICNGNSTTLTGSGATTYNWNPGNINGSSISVSPSSTTTYTVTGTNGNGCTNTAQITITVNPIPVVTASAANSSICFGGSTTLTGGGASTYNWNPGNINGSPITVSPAATTTYTVTGTSAAGCTNTAQVSVTVNPTPTITATASSDSICIGNSTTLNASGASTYNWNPGNLNGNYVSVSPVATTTYTVTGTDANGCTSTDQTTVTVNPLPVPTASANPTAICAGQNSTLTSSGASTYVWNGGSLVNANGSSQIVNPGGTTTYTVTATDAQGCSANAQVTLTVNPLPVVTASNDTTVCSGTTINLFATGGTNYSWNGGALVNAPGANQSVSPASSIGYTVVVTDANGCSANDTVNINVNALPIVNAGIDVSICQNSSIQLNASGAATYSWSPSTGLNFSNISNPVASPTVTTTYVVTGTSAAGCSSSDTMTVSISNNLTVTAGADVTICSGDTIQLSTSGGTVYAWTPSSSLQTPNSATTNAFPTATTTYVVNVTDANNCQGSDSVTVFVNGPVVLTTAGATTICIGQSATISATPSNGIAPYTYSWSNGLTGAGPQNVSPVTTTSYTVSVVDSTGCSSPTQTIIVTVNPPLTVAAINPVTVCSGTSVTLTANASGGDGNLSYSWMPGSLTTNPANVTPLVTTTYTLVVSDGCGTPPDTTTVTVNVNPSPTGIVSSSAENCNSLDGSAVVIASGGTPGYSYLWNNADTTATISNLSAGNYSVIITDANGCTVTQPVVVASNGSAVANAGSSVTIIQGDSTQLSGSGGTSYNWSPANSLNCPTCQNPVATPSVTTTYTLTVTDSLGCTATDTVTVFVDLNCGDIYLPNAFSPNHDGQNDVYYVRGNCIKFMQFEIYNRWGEKVFETGNPAVGWDGTWRGQECENAVFTYFLRVTLTDDTKVEKQGNISLVK